VQQIAKRTASADKCLEVSGHTSATGAADLNERLSLQRAEYVRDRLADTAGKQPVRFVAAGFGPRQMIVGTGKDDASDALDRRVEFKTVPCTGLTADAGRAAPNPPVAKAAAQPSSAKAEPKEKPAAAVEPKQKPAAAPAQKPAKKVARPRVYVDEDGNVRIPRMPSEVRRRLKAYGIEVD
jgi:pyruvate/2-oxoglutarate dehydrogenase complex dihydrolipoamide acyltransferase (E2) component